MFPRLGKKTVVKIVDLWKGLLGLSVPAVLLLGLAYLLLIWELGML